MFSAASGVKMCDWSEFASYIAHRANLTALSNGAVRSLGKKIDQPGNPTPTNERVYTLNEGKSNQLVITENSVKSTHVLTFQHDNQPAKVEILWGYAGRGANIFVAGEFAGSFTRGSMYLETQASDALKFVMGELVSTTKETDISGCTLD